MTAISTLNSSAGQGQTGLFAAANANANGMGGLFGLMMALFGGAGTQTAQNPLAMLQTSQGQGQKLPTTGMLPTLDAGQMMPRFENLSAEQQSTLLQGMLSKLQQLTGGEPLTADNLAAKLESLDADKTDALMAEMLALLQGAGVALPVLSDKNIVAAEAGSDGAQKIMPAVQGQKHHQDKEALQGMMALMLKHMKEGAATTEGAQASADMAQFAAQMVQRKQADTATQQAQDVMSSSTDAALLSNDQVSAALAAGLEKGALNAKAQGQHEGKHTPAAASTATVTSASSEAAQQVKPTEARPVAMTTADATAARGENAEKSASFGEALAAIDTAMPAKAESAAMPHLQKPEEAKQPASAEVIKFNRTGAHMPVTDQVSVHVSKALKNGQDHVVIKLNPAELGNIEVRLDMSQDGVVKAAFRVEQSATLELLQRDQRGLEKMLSDAGLKTEGSSLSFNLRDDGTGQQQSRQQQAQTEQNNQRNGGNGGRFENAALSDAAPAAGVMEMVWHISPERLDVRI